MSVILNLNKVSGFCFLGDQLVSYTVAEKQVSEENLCLPPAFGCFALDALTILLVYVASFNAMCLASALSWLSLKKGFGKPKVGELLQASHTKCDIQRPEQNACCLKHIEGLCELVPSSDAQEF